MFEFNFFFYNALAANYEITRRLISLSGWQTTRQLVLTYIEKSTCHYFFFLASFLKIAAAVNVLNRRKTLKNLLK